LALLALVAGVVAWPAAERGPILAALEATGIGRANARPLRALRWTRPVCNLPRM
jgi:hypothetical protein